VLAAGRPGVPEGAAALATLCEAYWRPVHAFIRRLMTESLRCPRLHRRGESVVGQPAPWV